QFLWLQQEGGRPLPKFGEWDVNDPASAEGYTAIFNKARDERKTGGNAQGAESPGKGDGAYKKRGLSSTKSAVSKLQLGSGVAAASKPVLHNPD
ncbi:hypothetical protein Taro_004216, partial [Colocasia esculenta]|nr:hypothetical protein [Colocasia esculenta]